MGGKECSTSRVFHVMGVYGREHRTLVPSHEGHTKIPLGGTPPAGPGPGLTECRRLT